MTNAEVLLWRELRKRKTGVSFRRQCPLFGFIVDFFAPACALAIEVDGPVHERRIDSDARRDERLGAAGIAILRFKNDEIIDELPRVVRTITARVSQRHGC